jgi:hypothetical protein
MTKSSQQLNIITCKGVMIQRACDELGHVVTPF